MNLTKSIFISLLFIMLAYTNGILAKDILDYGFNQQAIGLGLISLPLLAFFSTVLILQNTPRTTRYLNLILISALVGISYIAYLWILGGEYSTRIQHYYPLAILNFVLLLLYLFWYSTFATEAHKTLSVGEKLPHFIVYNGDIEIHSRDFDVNGRVFLFYRGNWCPFCVAQIKELVSHYQTAINSGLEFILISPQPDKKSQALAKKFDVPFIFATDRNNLAAKQLGIFNQYGLPLGMQLLGYQNDTPIPTVIRANSEGYITYFDQTNNYRVRPDPKNYTT